MENGILRVIICINHLKIRIQTRNNLPFFFITAHRLDIQAISIASPDSKVPYMEEGG